MPEPRSKCPECSAPLDADGGCLACLFGEALIACDSAGSESSESGFGNFAPHEAGEFGKYTLRRKLGAGGMGVIWEAEDSSVQRVVALKMIRGFAFSSDGEKQRFRSEATAIAQLDHPNIVSIYEVGETEEQPFFTMKLLEGGSLSQRLKKGVLKAKEAAHILEKLARAVHHAHQRGVLHRDLKPGNVLFDGDGEPHLTDFGLAKLVDVEQGMTLTHAQIGTPQYMSPEQARGSARDVTTASDLWALGAMLYQMLSGELPFPGSTAAEIFSGIEHTEPQPIRSITKSANRELETLCMRCLEKDPTQRMSDAGELADELARWQRGEPIRARRVSGGERALRWMRRHPWRVAAAASLIVSLLAGTIVSLLMWQSAEASRKTAVENAAAERLTGYRSTVGAALAARERHDFARARQLLALAPEEHRGMEWRLLANLCEGDQSEQFRLPDNGVPETLSLGPDGSSLAMVTAEGMLHLRAFDGTPIGEPRRLPELAGEPDLGTAMSLNFHSLRYAPGGRHFACSFRNTIRIFDSETLEVVFEQGIIEGVQSGWLDERRLLFGWDVTKTRRRKEGAWIFDLIEGTTTPLPAPWAGPLAVSDDGETVALTEDEHYRVGIFRTEDLTGPTPLTDAAPVARWQPRERGYGNVLRLSAGGEYIAALCGSRDSPAHRLEVAQLTTGRTFVTQPSRESLTGLAFHPTETKIAIVSADAVVRMMNFRIKVPKGAPSYDDAGAYLTRQRFDGNGPHTPPERLLSRSAQGGRVAYFLGHEGSGTGVLFAPDGDSLFTAARDGTVRRWGGEVPTPATRLDRAHLDKLALHPAASRDGSRILYVDHERRTFYWREGRRLARIAADHMPLAVLPGGRLATMERSSSDVILWQENEDTITQIDRIPGPGYIQNFRGLLRGVVGPGGTKIAGLLPGQLFVVDLTSGTVETSGDESWETGPARAWDLAISPDGKRVAVTGFGHQVQVFDTDQLKAAPQTIGTFRNYDTKLAFSPDGGRLFCGNEDGRVRVFETSTWSRITGEGWQAHRGAVTGLAMSNDGHRIATAGDTTLKLWRAGSDSGESRLALLSFSTYTPAAWLQFARDENGGDRALMHCPPFGPLEIWPAPHEPLRVAHPAAGATTRFRLRANYPPDAEEGAAHYAGWKVVDAETGNAAAVLVKEGDPDGSIFEFTSTKASDGTLFFKIENFPNPAGPDTAGKSAYFLSDNVGGFLVTIRSDDNPGKERGLLFPTDTINPTGEPPSGLTLESKFHRLPGSLLGYAAGEVALIKAEDHSPSSKLPYWELEPVETK